MRLRPGFLKATSNNAKKPPSSTKKSYVADRGDEDGAYTLPLPPKPVMELRIPSHTGTVRTQVSSPESTCQGNLSPFPVRCDDTGQAPTSLRHRSGIANPSSPSKKNSKAASSRWGWRRRSDSSGTVAEEEVVSYGSHGVGCPVGEGAGQKIGCRGSASCHRGDASAPSGSMEIDYQHDYTYDYRRQYQAYYCCECEGVNEEEELLLTERKRGEGNGISSSDEEDDFDKGFDDGAFCARCGNSSSIRDGVGATLRSYTSGAGGGSGDGHGVDRPEGRPDRDCSSSVAPANRSSSSRRRRRRSRSRRDHQSGKASLWSRTQQGFAEGHSVDRNDGHCCPSDSDWSEGDHSSTTSSCGRHRKRELASSCEAIVAQSSFGNLDSSTAEADKTKPTGTFGSASAAAADTVVNKAHGFAPAPAAAERADPARKDRSSTIGAPAETAAMAAAAVKVREDEETDQDNSRTRGASGNVRGEEDSGTQENPNSWWSAVVASRRRLVSGGGGDSGVATGTAEAIGGRDHHGNLFSQAVDAFVNAAAWAENPCTQTSCHAATGDGASSSTADSIGGSARGKVGVTVSPSYRVGTSGSGALPAAVGAAPNCDAGLTGPDVFFSPGAGRERRDVGGGEEGGDSDGAREGEHRCCLLLDSPFFCKENGTEGMKVVLENDDFREGFKQVSTRHR